VHEVFESWLDESPEGRRFFAYLHFMEAHDWHLDGMDGLQERLAGVPAQQLAVLREAHPHNCADEPDGLRCLKSVVYELAVQEMRLAIATILAGLEQRSELSDTLVLVYSDHGEEFWEHEAIQVVRNEDPREFKGIGHGQTLYQEQLHIPLLVWHPELAGGEIEANVSLVDVAPSVLAWLGISVPEAKFSGQYLPPLGPGRQADEPLFASGIAYGPEQVAVRKGVEKSIYSLPRDQLEIFNLRNDPGEFEPLDDPGLFFDFTTLTGDYLELPARYTGATGELSASQIEDLKAIGYLQGVEASPAPASEQQGDAAPIEIRATEDPEQP
jgi:arylsulfatase A-like enzyme